MPIRKHKPISEYKMYWYSPRNTICAVLRDIYFSTSNPHIRKKCRIATSMAKSMSVKLSEYKKDWEEGFWDDEEDNEKNDEKGVNSDK